MAAKTLRFSGSILFINEVTILEIKIWLNKEVKNVGQSYTKCGRFISCHSHLVSNLLSLYIALGIFSPKMKSRRFNWFLCCLQALTAPKEKFVKLLL